jgi:hypothetical protein
MGMDNQSEESRLQQNLQSHNGGEWLHDCTFITYWLFSNDYNLCFWNIKKGASFDAPLKLFFLVVLS